MGNTVTFEPGAHTAWHSHPLGQVFIVTTGHGRVQKRGGPMIRRTGAEVILTAIGGDRAANATQGE